MNTILIHRNFAIVLSKIARRLKKLSHHLLYQNLPEKIIVGGLTIHDIQPLGQTITAWSRCQRQSPWPDLEGLLGRSPGPGEKKQAQTSRQGKIQRHDRHLRPLSPGNDLRL